MFVFSNTAKNGHSYLDHPIANIIIDYLLIVSSVFQKRKLAYSILFEV